MLIESVSAAEQNKVAMAASIIYYETRPDVIWSSGAFRQKPTGDIKKNLRDQKTQVTDPCFVYFASACGILVRCDVWREVGLFDEQFFMYYEDLDWCWRLQRTNYRIMIVPDARMWHRGAVTIGGYDSPDERYYMSLSSVLFFRKHTAAWRWPVVTLFRFLSALKTSWRLKQNPIALIKHCQGLWDGLRT